MDIVTTWRTHRPMADLVLLFVPESYNSADSSIWRAFHIVASSYTLERSMDWFAALMRHHTSANWNFQRINARPQDQIDFAHAIERCPPALPVLFVPLPLAAKDENGFTEHAVRLFFSLAEELSARVMSDDSAATATGRAAQAARWSAHEALVCDASAHILPIHALAVRFQCRRVMRWVAARIMDVLDDDTGILLLSYAVESDARGAAVIRDEARPIYEQALMWYRCLRAPPAVQMPLDDRIAQLGQLCKQHTELDTFAPSVRITGPRAFEMRGAFAKCVGCYDTSISPDPIACGSTLVHGTTVQHEGGALMEGYWAMHLHEARCASGERRLTVRHIGIDAMRAFAERTRTNVCAPRAAATAIEAEIFAAKMAAASDSTSSNISTCVCRMSVRFVRRDRRVTRAEAVATFESGEFCMAAHATSVAKYTVYMPAHWRSDDYYVGYCSACRAVKPLAIFLYNLSITRLSDDAMRQGIVPDEPMPDAQPLAELVAA